jgi:hypothetical protein
MVSNTWVVPGSPLQDGNGWRIHYSRKGSAVFQPEPIVVTRGGKAVPTTQSPIELLRFLDDWPDQGRDRCTGIVELRIDDAEPGAAYEVLVPEAGWDKPVVWRTLPTQLPEEGVAFLFSSCFWRDDDVLGTYGAAIRDIARRDRIAFKLLIGDQVYTDWPASLLGSGFSLYADRYAEYWSDANYQEVLQACPNMVVGDDHEFWNDFPERQTHLSRTYFESDRIAYGTIAKALYDQYQASLNPRGERWFSFSIRPVSFFVADTRTERDYASGLGQDGKPKQAQFFQDDQWDALTAWFRGLRGPGVLVLGQPLYQKDGNWKDHSLSNFPRDYERLCELIAASYRGENDDGQPHQILMLSGDIHTGRLAIGHVVGIPDDHAQLPEFIASPASRIVPPYTGSFEEPPPAIPTRTDGRTPIIQPIEVEAVGTNRPGTQTVDNNIGRVKITPGTNGRVRFELSLWRVRPNDARGWANRTVGWSAQPRGPVVELFRRELELR